MSNPTYRGTDRTYYEKLPDGTLVTYALETRGGKDRRTYENHQSLEQFEALAAWALGQEAPAKATAEPDALHQGVLAGFKAAIALARMSERVGANVRASLEAAEDWEAPMILAMGERMTRAIETGETLVVHGQVSPEDLKAAEQAADAVSASAQTAE